MCSRHTYTSKLNTSESWDQISFLTCLFHWAFFKIAKPSYRVRTFPGGWQKKCCDAFCCQGPVHFVNAERLEPGSLVARTRSWWLSPPQLPSLMNIFLFCPVKEHCHLGLWPAAAKAEQLSPPAPAALQLCVYTFFLWEPLSPGPLSCPPWRLHLSRGSLKRSRLNPPIRCSVIQMGEATSLRSAPGWAELACVSAWTGSTRECRALGVFVVNTSSGVEPRGEQRD